MVKYYIDTCIWLNLFKQEGNPRKGKPFWKISRDFIEKILDSDNSQIYYSGLILDELIHNITKEEYFRVQDLIKKPKISRIEVIKDDYRLARKFESKSRFNLSYYDCIHIAVCKRLGMTLVTRDKRLLLFAGKFIDAKKPEDIKGY